MSKEIEEEEKEKSRAEKWRRGKSEKYEKRGWNVIENGRNRER